MAKSPMKLHQKSKSVLVLVLSLFFFGTKAQDFSGKWRAELPTVIGNLPFHFQIKTIEGNISAEFLNGDEILPFDTAILKNDTLTLKMLLFDAQLTLIKSGRYLLGVFEKKNASLNLRRADFIAIPDPGYRFKDAKLNADFNGKYNVTFTTPDGTYEAVGIFTSEKEKVKGTFLTTTGDYRFLEGNVVGDSLWLSCIDGNHVFLFKARIDGNTLSGGMFCSTFTYTETWEGKRNEKAELPNPDTITLLKPGFETIDFSFVDFSGKKISPKNPEYKNKILIVQILGSWCPNCMDETRFLADFYKKYKSKGVEVIGLAFEKELTRDFVEPKFQRMRERFGVTYPLVLAGKNEKKDASDKLPMLNQVVSFPTTIIIDKKGIVRKIHTGFSGPGTGIYYEKFVADFNTYIIDLLKDKREGK